MNKISHKRSRKPPRSPEQEQPFFSPGSTQQPFFNSTRGATAQPKLTIGEPNNAFEQEADAMAESVVNHSGNAQTTSSAEGQIHRQTMEEEKETAQAKPELMRQPEKEKEEMQAKPELMRQPEKEEKETAQAKPELMRQPEKEKEEMQAKPELMRQPEKEEEPVQAKTEPGQPAKPNLSQRLKHSKGEGRPLPAQTQKEMTQAFNYDFSDVTVHTDDEAVQMTRELKAQAFTHDNHIYFNEGKYNPESSSGKQLLAHELTHVAQQNPQ